MQKNKKFSTREIAYIGIFVAIGVVVNTLRMGIVSFGGLPIILSGYALGPGLGFIVGAVTDVVAYFIRPSSVGQFNLLFIMTSALTGMIPVIVTNILGSRYPNYEYWKVLIGVLVGQFITSVFLVPLFIDILYLPGSFWIKMSKAAIKQTVQAPVYAFFINEIIGSTYKLIKYRDLK